MRVQSAPRAAEVVYETRPVPVDELRPGDVMVHAGRQFRFWSLVPLVNQAGDVMLTSRRDPAGGWNGPRAAFRVLDPADAVVDVVVAPTRQERPARLEVSA